jgi:hypothetical protein
MVDTAQLLCERCETPLEADDLRCAICGYAAPHYVTANDKLVVDILRCTGCGAAVAYDPKKQAPSCSFCDSVFKVERITDPLEQTEGYLPFTITSQQAHQALKQWLASLGWFRPSDLSTSAQLEHLRPLWWVGWVFDAESFVSWTADSNAGSGRSSWAPHSGQANIDFDDILVSASRGLHDSEVAIITPGMDLKTVLAEPRGAEDATIEQFDLQRSQARQQVTASIQNLAASRVQQHHVPGSRFRKVNVSVVVRRLVTRRLSFPAYVLAYRYKDSLYRVVICGQDPSRIIGNAPRSWAKIALLIAALIAAFVVFMVIVAAANA